MFWLAWVVVSVAAGGRFGALTLTARGDHEEKDGEEEREADKTHSGEANRRALGCRAISAQMSPRTGLHSPADVRQTTLS